MDLRGRNALVTGGDQGIGQAIAITLAERGADVVVNYRSNRDAAEETRGRIRELGRNTSAIQADVGDIGEAKRLIDEAITALSQVDILVNNAGIEKRAPFLDATADDYRDVINVNMTGPYFLAQEFARRRRDAGGGGRIINISSVHEELPFPNFTSYCMAKGGLKMMMRNLAVELAPLGITVNNVAPGAIETPMNRRLLADPKLLEPLLANIPLHRLGQPAEVAHVVAFLASTEADYITGATIVIDGGLLWNYQEQ